MENETCRYVIIDVEIVRYMLHTVSIFVLHGIFLPREWCNENSEEIKVPIFFTRSIQFSRFSEGRIVKIDNGIVNSSVYYIKLKKIWKAVGMKVFHCYLKGIRYHKSIFMI